MLRGKKILAVLSELAEDKVKELCKNPFFDEKYEVFHLKGIKNPIAYIKGAWCLETLGEKLSKGFKFTDIDGFLEHYNIMLFLEFKTSPHYLKPRQLAALFRLVEKTSATLFVVFG